MNSHGRNFHPRTLAMYQRCPTTDYELLSDPDAGKRELARTTPELDQYKRAPPAHLDFVLLSDPNYGKRALARMTAALAADVDALQMQVQALMYGSVDEVAMLLREKREKEQSTQQEIPKAKL